jgi:hypothetical protein
VTLSSSSPSSSPSSFSLSRLLRVPKPTISILYYKQSIFNNAINLFYDSLVILSNSIGFPEYSQPLLYSLRKITRIFSPRWSKNQKDLKQSGGKREKETVLAEYAQQIKTLVALIIKNVEYIVKKRSQLPGDVYPSRLDGSLVNK